MRYDYLRKLYPDIIKLFETVQELIHAGAGIEMAVAECLDWIDKNVNRADHRQAILEKLRQFGCLVETGGVSGF